MTRGNTVDTTMTMIMIMKTAYRFEVRLRHSLGMDGLGDISSNGQIRMTPEPNPNNMKETRTCPWLVSSTHSREQVSDPIGDLS